MTLNIIIGMQVQLSTRVTTLFLILGLTSFATVPITVTYANARLDGLTGSAAVSTVVMARAHPHPHHH